MHVNMHTEKKNDHYMCNKTSINQCLFFEKKKGLVLDVLCF